MLLLVRLVLQAQHALLVQRHSMFPAPQHTLTVSSYTDIQPKSTCSQTYLSAVVSAAAVSGLMVSARGSESFSLLFSTTEGSHNWIEGENERRKILTAADLSQLYDQSCPAKSRMITERWHRVQAGPQDCQNLFKIDFCMSVCLSAKLQQ